MEQEIQKIWEQAEAYPDDRVKLIVWLECLGLLRREEMFIAFFEALRRADCLEWQEKYFLYWQAFGKMFTKADVCSEEVLAKRFEAYRGITEEFQGKFSDLRPLADRNRNVVLVTTQQFLGMQHGPTKTTLDRAYMLAKMGRQVIIVNTAELYGGNFERGGGAYILPGYKEDLNKKEYVEYCGLKFPFVQFPKGMPDMENAEIFFSYVRKLKPAYIVNIGGDSLMLDGCAKMVPVLNINTVPSGISCTQAAKQVLGRPVCAKDERLLQCLGKTSEDVIAGRFTSSLKPQENHFSLEELGLPRNAFLLAVVGTRLAEEIDDSFLDMLKERFDEGAFLVIIGRMDNYESVCRRRSGLGEHSAYLGMQSDILAVLECCDLYVNPRRTGGGTSVIEAMYKGLPAVSLNEGDVSLGAGDMFCVKNYDEMSRQISRYMNDKEFYEEMSAKAKERAAYMLDTESAFSEILSQFEQEIYA